MRSTPLSFHYVNPLIEKFGTGFFKEIPRSAGVYFMHDAEGEILYIGKAKELRARLGQYKQAKPGSATDHTLEMLEHVERIRWEEHESEQKAVLRESELLHAVRPPFNIAGTEAQHYLYIGLKQETRSSAKGPAKAHFQLTSRREIAQGYRIFGCYKHRRRTKTGYTALLRLLHAASADPAGRKRFSFPARITRSAPPYLYSMELSRELIEPLERFLSGRSSRLLRLVLERMLANEQIPRFMHPGIQDDLETVQEFFRFGPRATHQLKQVHGLKTRVVSHRRMDQLLRLSCAEETVQAS
jgi:excinuclease UvrABC nuclease subunit